VSVVGDNFTNRSGDDICRYIQWHWRELGYGPSLRAIATAFGMNSTSTCLDVIRNLEKQGKIVRGPGFRTIRVKAGFSPDICEHDWRVKDPVPQNGEVKVKCVLCQFETAKEFHPDPENPKTWLRFVQ